jgi:hypothetical protein
MFVCAPSKRGMCLASDVAVGLLHIIAEFANQMPTQLIQIIMISLCLVDILCNNIY